MRLRENLKKEILLKKRITITDEEANKYSSYSDPITISAITWQASGQVEAQQYGKDLKYIRNMHYDGLEEITIGDIICISENEPYEVISVNNDYSPKQFTLRYKNG